MEFKRYPSIERADNIKNMEWWLTNYPELKNEKFIITEKLDGTNIVIGMQSFEEKVYIGRRNGWLKEDEDHFGIKEILSKNPTDVIVSYCNPSKESLNFPFYFYAELVGPKINGRIKYGEKSLYLLDVLENNKIINYHTHNLKIADNLTFEEAINFDITNLYSQIAPEIDGKKQYAEGIVIRPQNKEYFAPNGSRFILKKHTPHFDEIKGTKQIREPKVLSELQLEFLNYVNENRLVSIFSKHGPIKDRTEMGKYIKLLVEDAKEDFIKIFPGEHDRDTFSMGGKIAPKLLLKYI